MTNSKEKRKFAQVNEKYSLATQELIVKYKENYYKGLKNL